MREAAFDGTWGGWRDAARALLRANVAPGAVVWRAATDPQPSLGGLLEPAGDVVAADADPGAAAAPRVPRAFLDVAERAAHHRDRGRWDALYRVLWRLTHGEPHLLDVEVDADVRRVLVMERAVRREIHKVHAFVRFRRVLVPARDAAQGAGGDGGSVEHYVAWLAPAHPVLPLAAPFFARRFGGMRWGILTPERSVFWDGARLLHGPGVPQRAAPDDDPTEELWRTYYANVFNPARLRPTAMRAEMPKRWWAALPEAALIPALMGDAARRTREMVERSRRAPDDAPDDAPDGAPDGAAGDR